MIYWVFVIPTVRIEGLPLILLEALSCGCATIASEIGGIPSTLKHEVNGLLVPAGDVDKLSQKINFVNNLGDEDLKKFYFKRVP